MAGAIRLGILGVALAGVMAAGNPAAADAASCTGSTTAQSGGAISVSFSCDFDNHKGGFAVILNRPITGHAGFDGFECGVPTGETESDRKALEGTLRCHNPVPQSRDPAERDRFRFIAAGTEISGTVDTSGYDCGTDPLSVTIEWWEYLPSESGDPLEDQIAPRYFALPGPCGKQQVDGSLGVTAPAKQAPESLGVGIQCFTGCQVKAVATIKLPRGMTAAKSKVLKLSASRILASGGHAFLALKAKGRKAKVLKKALRRRKKLTARIKVSSTDTAGSERTGTLIRDVTIRR